MPTTITSAGVTFNDTTSLTSATLVANSVGTTQITNGSVTAAKLGTTEQKRICKAWVNFDGTTSPGTIRSSYNVSSVTKNAVGDYTVNFTTAMADANYSVSGNAKLEGTVGNSQDSNYVQLNTLSTSGVRIYVTNGISNNQRDSSIVAVTIFGN